MTTKPKPHKVRKGGNPNPSQHVNPAVRPDDGRLAAVPTTNFNVRFPVPLLEQVKATAEAQGITPTELIRNAVMAHLDGQAKGEG